MVYVTSDLHGYPLNKFKKLLKKADFGDEDFCFVLGDVIDRGKDGVKTLLWLMNQPNFSLVLGNHELMMLDCDFVCEDITHESIAGLTEEKLDIYYTWLSNGGETTLGGLHKLSKSRRKDVFDFLRDAPLYETVTVNGRDFILTHSGFGSFGKNKKLSEYTAYDLTWNRPSLETRYFDGITTVFGHTPTLVYGSKFMDKAIFTETWIDIDTGAAGGGAPMLLRLDDLKEFYTD